MRSRFLRLRPVRNESGLALVIVMVLAAAAIIIMAGLLYMVTSGTEFSGTAARYTNALQAAVGGVDGARQYIEQQGTAPNLPNILVSTGSKCMVNGQNMKLTTLTQNWPAGCDKSFIINTTDQNTYDFTATLGNYQVYSKIVDTIPGNTAAASGLVKTGVVETSPGKVRQIPYIYTLYTLSVSAAGAERSQVSAVYQY